MSGAVADLMAAVEPFVRAYRAMSAFQQTRPELVLRVERPGQVGGAISSLDQLHFEALVAAYEGMGVSGAATQAGEVSK